MRLVWGAMTTVTTNGYRANKNLDLQFCTHDGKVRGIRQAGSPVNDPAEVQKELKIEGRFFVDVGVRLKERDNSRMSRDLSEDLAQATATYWEPKFLHISLLDEEENYEESWIKNHISRTVSARGHYDRGPCRTRTTERQWRCYATGMSLSILRMCPHSKCAELSS